MVNDMDERLELSCIVGDEIKDAVVELYDGIICKIRFISGEMHYETAAENYFYALRELRKILEPLGIKLLCKGCARNVYPSPMILDMGCAIKAYEMTLGKRALIKDLVYIFDPCKPEDYATIAEQDAFYDEWISSLRN